MSDKCSLWFKIAPKIEVRVTAPCIFLMEGAICIEQDAEGNEVTGFLLDTLTSFHITKEI